MSVPPWVPIVMMVLGLVSFVVSLVTQFKLPEIVRYAIRSEIRDQVLAHNLDERAHREMAELKRLRHHAHGVDNTLQAMIFATHIPGSPPITVQRLEKDE